MADDANDAVFLTCWLQPLSDIQRQFSRDWRDLRRLFRARLDSLESLTLDEVIDFDDRLTMLQSVASQLGTLFALTGRDEWGLVAGKMEVRCEALRLAMINHECFRFACLNLVRLQPVHSETARDVWLLRRITRPSVRDGTPLTGAQRSKLRSLRRQRGRDERQFSENVRLATLACQCYVDEARLLDGLPTAFVSQAARRARACELNGWLFQVDMASLELVFRMGTVPELHQRFAAAFESRATLAAVDHGYGKTEWDNGPVIQSILVSRQKEAQLLGFADWAALRLDEAHIGQVGQVRRFLSELRKRTTNGEFACLRSEVAGGNSLKVRRFSDCFKMSSTFVRIIDLLSVLFSIRIEEISIIGWAKGVKCYRVVRDEEGLAGYIYLDFEAREKKREGAWVAVMQFSTTISGGLPAIAICCNFQSAGLENPSLEHADLVSLLHEWGHALQFVLCPVGEAGIARQRYLPPDVIEFPSECLALLASDLEILLFLCSHDTSPDLVELFLDSIQSSRMEAATRKQALLHVAEVDLAIHSAKRFEGDATSESLAKAMSRGSLHDMPANQSSEMSLPDWLHTDLHIFKYGYDSMMYSYLWSEEFAQTAVDALLSIWASGEIDVLAGRVARSALFESKNPDHAIQILASFSASR